MKTEHWHRGTSWPCPVPGCGSKLHSVVILGIHVEQHQRDDRRQIPLDFGCEPDLPFNRQPNHLTTSTNH